MQDAALICSLAIGAAGALGLWWYARAGTREQREVERLHEALAAACASELTGHAEMGRVERVATELAYAYARRDVMPLGDQEQRGEQQAAMAVAVAELAASLADKARAAARRRAA